MVKWRAVSGNGGSQRGVAFIIVLVLLAVGSLIIPPWLQFVQTALHASYLSRDTLKDDTSASAGVRQAIWRLQTNDGGLFDLLSPENPTASYSVLLNGMEVFVEVTVPQVPDPPPPPPQQSGPHLHVGKSRSVKWLKYNEAKSFTYTINVTNYGSSTMHIGELGDTIPPPFCYIAGSSSGITCADPTITLDNNRQVLTWILDAPLPRLNAGQTRTQTFTVVHTGGNSGMYYNEGWAVDYPRSIGKVPSGPTAPVAIGVYNIRVHARSAVVKSQVSVSDTESSIILWE